MKLITTSALAAYVFWTCPAQSFDLHTHVAMTAKAVEKSALGVNPASSAVISRLGLTRLTSSIYDRYETLFNAPGNNLATLVDGLGVIQEVRVSDDLGEFLIVRNTPDGPIGFMVYFIRAEDGIWRIDSM